ncbi:hypothetical protein EVAR_56885_1 [Eumeta japonica]|uniref:Uncharacterized protein n=1 Tax=Eumeta variegata TaxID=151549 RepID=A0A4C1ZBP8_EUMVA|nr:hypothetical protein EVAR_56885_1 [Eumeta japonica]
MTTSRPFAVAFGCNDADTREGRGVCERTTPDCCEIRSYDLRSLLNLIKKCPARGFAPGIFFFIQAFINYIPKPSSWFTLSAGENRIQIRAVVFEFIANGQTDAAEDFVL